MEWRVLLASWHIKYIIAESGDEKLKFASLLTTALTPPDKLMEALRQLWPDKLETLPAVQPNVFRRTCQIHVVTFDGSVTTDMVYHGVVCQRSNNLCPLAPSVDSP